MGGVNLPPFSYAGHDLGDGRVLLEGEAERLSSWRNNLQHHTVIMLWEGVAQVQH